MATYYGAAHESDLTPECMVEHFIEPLFLVYFAAVIVLLCGLFFVIKGHLRHKAILKARNLPTEDDEEEEESQLPDESPRHINPLSPQFATEESLRRCSAPP